MTRRGLIRYSYTLCLLAVMDELTFGMSQSRPSEFKVVFSLPETMTHEDFRKSVPRWVNVQKYLGMIEKYRNRGTLLSSSEKRVGQNGLQREFSFSSDAEMLSFCRETMASCDYDFKARQSLGIVTTSYINGAVKDFFGSPIDLEIASKT